MTDYEQGDSIRRTYGEIYGAVRGSDSAEHDFELSRDGVANRIGNLERRNEQRRHVGARCRNPGGADVIAHVAGGELRSRALEEYRASANVRAGGVSRREAASLLGGRHVVVDCRRRDRVYGLVGKHVDRFDGGVGCVGESDGDRVLLLRVSDGASFAVERQRQNELTVRLLGIIEETLKLWSIGILPNGVDGAARRSATGDLLRPVRLIKVRILVGECLNEEPQPIAVDGTREHSVEDAE